MLRVLAVVQLDATPFVHMERWAQTDMHYYDGWARQIAAGDWLSRRLPLPMHRWQHEVAQAYFARHPDAKTALEHEGGDADTAIWAQWMQSPRFYQDPLYPYLIAIIYRAAADVRAILVLQLTAGVLSTLLVWSLARRHFGELAGGIAGTLAVLCAPLVFYELLLLRDSLIACAGLAIVWLADRAAASAARRWFTALGAMLAAAFVLKSSFVLLAVPIVPITLAAARRAGRPIAVRSVALGLGAVIVLLPFAIRNLRTGVAPLAPASSGPLTFLSANDPNARPDIGFGINTPMLADFLGGTDGSWRAAIDATASGTTPRRYTAQLWRKWDRSWHWYEIPNNENLYYLRQQVPVLAWLPVTFWLVAPLALVGLALAIARRPRPWTLLSLVACCVTALLAFYVLGRFRVSLIAGVLPFAGLAVADLAVACLARRYTRAAAIAASIVAIGLWTGRPIADDQILIRTSDYILAWSVEYQDRVYGALDRKDPAAAGAAYQEFFARYEPSDTDIVNAADPHLAPELADMHVECAQILRAARRPEAADVQTDAARRLLALRPAQ